MCLIIETQKDITIPKFVMQDMHQRNDDGYGFMYLRDGVVHGEKYQGNTLDELYEKYLELKEFAPYIHLRMKTHGDINPEQSHPFDCGHGIWMMHNGILSGVQGDDQSKSDTWYFANEYLRPWFNTARDPGELLALDSFQIMISKFIGSNNRIVIMDKRGGLRFNDSSWHVITNEETQCVGMRVSNTYAWNMHSKKVTHHYPTTRTNQHHRGNGGNNYKGSNSYSGSSTSSSQTVIVPPGIPKSESKPNDPPGSFRDQQGELWVYTGRGWMQAKRYNELYPDKQTEFTRFYGSQEVSQSHPTCQKTDAKSSSSNGNEQESEKSNVSCLNERRRLRQSPKMSFIDNDDSEAVFGLTEEEEKEYNLDLYEDYLYDEWGSLTYSEVQQRVKDDPESAADIIAFALAIKIES